MTPTAGTMPKLILCVEDEPDLLTDIADELRAAGYEVTEALDGRAALEALRERAPDLVLCDITMPGMTGFEVLSHLRAERPDLAGVPFIFLTALADRLDVIAGKEAGADDYLVKPIDFDVMLATVAARLRQVSRMREALPAVEGTGPSSRPVPKADIALSGMAEALNRVALGVFLIGAERRVTFVNRTGSQMLKDGDGLAVSREGGLRGAGPQQTRALEDLVEAALASLRGGVPGGEGGVSLTRPSGRRSFTALVCPLAAGDSGADQPVVAVFVSDPERRPHAPADILARLYRLTPAETRLAHALAEGQRIEEISASFGISRNTIAYTLRNLFRKTETERQADLVSLFLSNPVAIGPESQADGADATTRAGRDL